MKLIPALSLGLIVLSPIVFSQAAFADDWPTSVVGNWSVNANNSTGILSITNQAPTGNCRAISGSIFGNPLIRGFYCPFSGRINFIRQSGNSFQVYSGNISQNASTVRIGGLFTDYSQPGEYSFFGSK
ncbi:hypothetical protein LC612_05950 [Nostoc sp. CHAB 5834]|nr:hypothetical protein [Nostoc sp. CHAB 5834]